MNLNTLCISSHINVIIGYRKQNSGVAIHISALPVHGPRGLYYNLLSHSNSKL